MPHRTDIVPVPPIGARFAALRQEAGLTQEALADRMRELGWSKPSTLVIYKLENDLRKLDAHEFAILAEALGCTVQDFFGVSRARRRR